MKKNLLQKLITASALIFCLTFSIKGKAQIMSYVVTNNLSCDVEVAYNFYDGICSNTPCGSSSSGVITILAGSFQSIPGCAAATEIEITVNWVDAASCSATQTPAPVGVNLTCGATSGTATITTSGSGCSCSTSTISMSTSGASIN